MKKVAPTRALKVLDRAIQGFGAAGISKIYRCCTLGKCMDVEAC
jgi:hypothetical protein